VGAGGLAHGGCVRHHQRRRHGADPLETPIAFQRTPLKSLLNCTVGLVLKVRLWSTTSRELLACVRMVDKPLPLPNLGSMNSGCVRSVAFSPDGKTLAAGACRNPESSLGDAKSSLGDAKSSLGDAKSSLGDAKSSLGDAKSSLGDG
jgi:WD40 repeat protein